MRTYHVAVRKHPGPGIAVGCQRSAAEARRIAGPEGTVVKVDAPNWNTAVAMAVTLALQAENDRADNVSCPTGPLAALVSPAGTNR